MSSDDPINAIYFERQQSALCAQHALNMLLQDSLFTYENLRDLARQMDRLEHDILGNNANTPGRSENMNDSGFFSIQVIEKALETFELKLTNIEHHEMVAFKENPLIARAYICNLKLHWFTIRKFGNQWFELNSTNRGPKLLSDTYVREFFFQLSAEGYSIFVVQGILPPSHADDLITLCPVVVVKIPAKKEQKPENVVQKFFTTVGRRLGGTISGPPDTQEDKDLAIAMAMSMETRDDVTKDSDEIQLEKAIQMSLGVSDATNSEASTSSRNSESPVESSVSIQKAIEESFGDSGAPTSSGKDSEVAETPILGPMTSSEASTSSDSKMESTESTEATVTPREQQRKDREAFLQRLEKKNDN